MIWLWSGRNVVPGRVAEIVEPAREPVSPDAKVSLSKAKMPSDMLGTRAGADAVAVESEETARTKIETLMVAYDASALPGLAEYLAHPLAEVRAMARDGVVQLGAEEGAPLLRAAADKAKDPREAVALLDAADFLDLPPAEPSRRARPAPAR